MFYSILIGVLDVFLVLEIIIIGLYDVIIVKIYEMCRFVIFDGLIMLIIGEGDEEFNERCVEYNLCLFFGVVYILDIGYIYDFCEYMVLLFKCVVVMMIFGLCRCMLK